MTTQEGERYLLRTLAGPKGEANVYQVTPPGMGQGEVKYEVDFGGRKLVFPTIGEAMVEAEGLVETKV